MDSKNRELVNVVSCISYLVSESLKLEQVMSDSIVIIPTYNEKENIEKIIRAVFGLEKQFDILVIDDGSPDGTAAIVKNLDG